ncbi:unnamed protein product [Strongylus vulgaris]|uniref:Receptor expression-enhancing protein n=1 Tax=Strongylus vulgaris TaxID=40348 RepID=A0A3P7IS33_STRVU|nr:unnamed protein product [Strongylus vulgaris]
METLGDIIHDRVYNQKWFTARGLRSLSEATGWGVDTIAKVIACLLFYLLNGGSDWFVCNLLLVLVPMLLIYIAKIIACLLFYLLNGGSDWFVCNLLLVLVPMLLIYVYPDEQPPLDHMIVYWISAFVLSACDHMLEDLPFYYLQKFCLLLFILVEPSCLNDRLKVLFKVNVPEYYNVPKKEDDVSTAKSSSAWEKFKESLLSLTTGPCTTVQRHQVVTHKTRVVTPAWEKFKESLLSLTTGPCTTVQRHQVVTHKTRVVTPGSRSDSERLIPGSGSSSSDSSPRDQRQLHRHKKTVTAETKVVHSSGATYKSALIAPGPPVAVGENRKIDSVYVNLPKPIGTQNKISVRLEPALRTSRSDNRNESS